MTILPHVLESRASATFIGRAGDLAALERMFESGERCVSITGPAGIGKTRLVLEYARRCLEAGRESTVVYCDVTDCTGPVEICAALAHALGVPLAGATSPADAIAPIARAIEAANDPLIIVDNFEHVVEHAHIIESCHTLAPMGCWLITSRDILRIAPEVVYELEPLELPEPDGDPLASEAVELLVDRVRRLRRGFVIAEGDQDAVVEIVQRLDGIPLAIELAAQRVSVYGAAVVSSRLRDSLELLSQPGATRRPSLRAEIERSFKLLDQSEQLVFAACSVFRGGFSLDALEAVAGDLALERPVVDTLQALREKSLVHDVTTDGREVRFDLYICIRECAAAKLIELGIHDAVVERHAHHYLASAERRAGELETARGPEAWRALVLEQANLRAVLAATGEPSDPAALERALRAMLALDPIVRNHSPLGPHTESLERLIAAAEAMESVPPTLVARARIALVADRLVDRRPPPRQAPPHSGIANGERAIRSLPSTEAMLAHLALACELAEQAGDRACAGRAARAKGVLEFVRGDYRRALKTLQGALAIHRREGDTEGEQLTLADIAKCARELGRLPLAEALWREAAAISRSVGNRRREGIALGCIGLPLLDRGRIDEAIEYFEQALAVHVEYDNRLSRVWTLGMMGMARHLSGDLAAADAAYGEALASASRLGKIGYRGDFYVALLHHEQGRFAEAASILRRTLGAAREVGDRGTELLSLAQLVSVEAAAGRFDIARLHLDAASSLRGSESRGPTTLLEIHGARLAIAAAGGDGASERARFAELIAGVKPSSHPLPTELYLPILVVDRELAHATPAEGPSPSERAIKVHPEGFWFELPGEPRISCRRRGPIRLLLQALAERRIEAPGQAFHPRELVDVGWPGERILAHAAHGRLRMALTTLRKLGLRDVLIRNDDGYLFDPAMALRLVRE